MERHVYVRMAEQESEHWWFAARRRLIAAIIRRHGALPEGARILEAGCGTGGNLEMLSDFGALDAFEYDAEARETAKAKSGLKVPYGALPGNIPFDGRDYHLIGLFDVLEHIEEDRASLAALSARLAEGGRIVLTAPAFPSLWSRHDETHQHFRRYTASSLREVAEAAGLRPVAIGYFNTLLSPLIVCARWLKARIGSDAPDDRMPSATVNGILYRVFSFERHFVGRLPMPFGISLYAVLELADAPVPD